MKDDLNPAAEVERLIQRQALEAQLATTLLPILVDAGELIVPLPTFEDYVVSRTAINAYTPAEIAVFAAQSQTDYMRLVVNDMRARDIITTYVAFKSSLSERSDLWDTWTAEFRHEAIAKLFLDAQWSPAWKTLLDTLVPGDDPSEEYIAAYEARKVADEAQVELMRAHYAQLRAHLLQVIEAHGLEASAVHAQIVGHLITIYVGKTEVMKLLALLGETDSTGEDFLRLDLYKSLADSGEDPTHPAWQAAVDQLFGN